MVDPSLGVWERRHKQNIDRFSAMEKELARMNARQEILDKKVDSLLELVCTGNLLRRFLVWTIGIIIAALAAWAEWRRG